jgi:hypothetical protein
MMLLVGFKPVPAEDGMVRVEHSNQYTNDVILVSPKILVFFTKFTRFLADFFQEISKNLLILRQFFKE